MGRNMNPISSLIIPTKAPLHPLDTAEQTYGCRRSSPTYCLNYEAQGVCALVREDCICRKPPQSWKFSYKELKKE